MAFAYKKRGTWYAGYRDAAGQHRRTATKLKSKAATLLYAQDLERKAARVFNGLEPDPEQSTHTLGSLCEWWLDNRCPPASCERAGQTLRRNVIETEVGALPVALVTVAKLEEHFRKLERQGFAPASINHIRAYLRAAFNKARKAAIWSGQNPAADTEARKVPRRAYVTLTAEEVPVMLAKVADDWRGFMAAGAYLGLRKGEAAGVRKTDVDLDHGLLTVRASYDHDTTKGGHADVLPIPPPLMPYVEAAMMTRGPYLFPAADGSMRTHESDPQKALRTALGQAGIVDGYDCVCRRCKARGKREHTWRHADKAMRVCPGCGMRLWPVAIPRPLRFHDLRHSAATVLLRAGVDAHRVQRILRHASVTTTTATYGHLLAEDLRDAMSTAWGGTPLERPTEPVEAARAAAGGADPEFHVTRLSPGEPTPANGAEAPPRNIRALRGNSVARPAGFEPAAPGLEVPIGTQAPSSTGLHCRGMTGQRSASCDPVKREVAPACHPVVTQTRRSVRAVDGGARDLLSVREVAKRLGVCTATVYTLCERGELAHVRVSNAIRVMPADLVAYLAASRKGGRP